MMYKSRKLLIIGDSAFAQIACEYFTAESDYEVTGFSVEASHLKRSTTLGRPVVAFEDCERRFPPEDHFVFVATVYTQLNRLRARLLQAARAKGYRAASFVSPHAFVWKNVTLGEHCFIFENNVVQPFVSLGSNVILWSGNHIGHHSTIGDNVFIASHAVISGYCNIGASCFIGVNATISNNISVGSDCIIGAGAMVSRDVDEDRVVRRDSDEPAGSARRLSRVR